MRARGAWAALALAAAAPGPAWAGAYDFAGYANGLDVVAHPEGYSGSGGNVQVTVCIDPTSANASDMVIPTENAIRVLNDLVPTTGNVVLGGANNVPAAAFDFESVLLHELGHAVGLAHPNLGFLVDSNNMAITLSPAEQDFTNSTDGTDDGDTTIADFDLDDGADDVIGSADDPRGDDENLHWFRTSNNNPFTIDPTVDSSTYSRDLADLPGGHDYPANCSYDVAAELGFPLTECVMQQGTFNDEAQRTLGHDDVASLRYAMAGIDESQGNSDDYTLELLYGGLTTSGCEIVIDFDDGETGFAVTQFSGFFVGGDHVAMADVSVFFSTGTVMGNEFDWFFNDVSNAPPGLPVSLPLGRALLALALLAAAALPLARRR